jgi:hypothetical protein
MDSADGKFALCYVSYACSCVKYYAIAPSWSMASNCKGIGSVPG